MCTRITIYIAILHSTAFVHRMNYAIGADRIETFIELENLFKGGRKAKT